ncbi:hypothetical protein KPZU09_63420 [Klebsiella pneumoniae]|uniref:Uncharacterized protein n=1 Tax=Klebsiella pneumoniae TaxID=573 RepID=A0A919LRL6_KLEPN|nr:hypothetical protein KPZU09_63420 [Klebsiella pneumoniae]
MPKIPRRWCATAAGPVITRQAAGHDGFGYDPIFFVPSEGKTAAELSREEKSAISHRGQALKLLLEALRNG